MLIFSLITIVFCSVQSIKANFDDFSRPAMKEIKLIEKIEKQIIKKPKTKKNKKILSAIIWQLPDRNFLGKRLRKYEEEIIDKEAITKLVDAASIKNPDAYKIYWNADKNSQYLHELSNLITNNRLDVLKNYFVNENTKKEIQKKIVIDEIQKIEKLYQELKAFYKPDQKKIINKQKYHELKEQISICCGLENFLYIENLLKREINYEVVNI